MKKDKQSNRTRIVGLRLSVEEFKLIQKEFEATTCQKLSVYLRNQVLKKPITSTYRNSSADELLAELAVLRNELNRIGNNFNQSVKRLHTLTLGTPFKQWQISHELERQTLFNKVDEIKKQMRIIVELWSR